MPFATLILAAGAGTRMKSERAKVAHALLGKPMIRWIVDAAAAATGLAAGSVAAANPPSQGADAAQVITVIGHQREQVEQLVADTTIVVQEERLGTGHAVMMARSKLLELPADTSLVVLNGDTPLITAATISALAVARAEDAAAATVLTFKLDDPTNYGRIIRDHADKVLRIVEEKDATPEERACKECNSGAYCFELSALLAQLDKLSNDNAQGEYYLTDVIGLYVAEGLPVTAHIVDAEEVQGINSRVQLALASKALQRRINKEHMEAGVTMLDPELVWVEAGVEIENDVELLPLTFLRGVTRVGSGSVLGPNTRVTDSTIGRGCHIVETEIIDALLEDNVACGPRAYLRPGTVMKAGSKAGTHVEIKNSTVGSNSKVPHLSYIGDATLGSDVNIGAGTITCNYDGISKNPTTIGDRAFIGSATMLIAPVTVGADAVTGAGSAIAKDVPESALALERNKQTTIENWKERQ